MAEKEDAVQEALSEALDPETAVELDGKGNAKSAWKTFSVDGSDFQIRPLTWRWEKLWRKFALPVLGAELRPLETLFAAIIGKRAEFTVDDVGFTRAIVDSEIEADVYLSKAVAVICASQDPEATKISDKMKRVEFWDEKITDAMTREELEGVVKNQAAIQKDVQRLGESLSTRFRVITNLVGNRFDIASLLQLGKLPASPSSDSDGKTA